MRTMQRILNRCCIVCIAVICGHSLERVDSPPKQVVCQTLRASSRRLDGDGKKCPNGLAIVIDPLGSGSAQVDTRLALWVASSTHFKFDVSGHASLVSLNVVEKVTGS